MDGLLVEPTRVPGSRLRLHLEIEGTADHGGYPEDVVDTVKANARDLRLDDDNLGFEEKQDIPCSTDQPRGQSRCAGERLPLPHAGGK